MLKEINRILSYATVDLRLIEGEEKDTVIKNIEDTFVRNNPRAYWLDFKYLAELIPYHQDYPYLKLTELIENENSINYLLIDDFNTNYYLLKGEFKHIFFFIGECEGLDEYYIVDENVEKIICENDHDEILYIDINKSREK